MCGIAGVWIAGGAASDRLAAMAKSMGNAVAHRGPDDSGEFVDAAAGVALAFRRLAILDLSPAGHQPMESASGRYVVIFNGEVYNYEAIRAELGDAIAYRGHSDTEVMLAAFERWGVRAVERFVGMFAIALWDRRDRALHLIRDRMGVKPLHYGWSNGALLFGSELKALAASGLLDDTIDRDAVRMYGALGYIPAPQTIYRDVKKLAPGTIATIRDGSREAQLETYWSVRDVARRGVETAFRGTFDEAVDRVGELVSESVRLRMIADVPLGVFLSGGVDSSLVTSMMRRHGRVRTFTIGFADEALDEAKYARAIAKQLGTEHTEEYVTAEETLRIVPMLPRMFDEPFGDSSMIPTFLVSRMARKHVTVALSGDGGDELFAGYHRYFLGRKLWAKRARVPRMLRGLAAVSARAAGAVAPRYAARAAGLAGALRMSHPDELYRQSMSRWSPAPALDADGIDDMTSRAMLFDQRTYLPDDILAKVDRASMAASLEAREPLLDYRLVEFAWTLPPHFNLEATRGKRVLRELLARELPRPLFERDKQGFALPVGGWLRGPLREWAESLLAPQLIGEWFDVRAVGEAWRAHLAGTQNRESELWIVLMFAAWLRERQRGL